MSPTAELAGVTLIPLALAAVSWLGSGVILGRLFPFPAGWLFFAAGAVVACAFTGRGACTAAAGASVLVAGAWWGLADSSGTGRAVLRAAARRWAEEPHGMPRFPSR